MTKRLFAVFSVLAIATSLSLGAIPASADHTDPNTPQAPTSPGLSGAGVENPNGIPTGVWDHIVNFPANPGTDLQFWRRDNVGNVFGAFGTLGTAPSNSVGQRIIHLVRNGVVDPTWRADHGSAKCDAGTAVTGLQHDPQIAGSGVGVHEGGLGRLLIDTTDAVARCHDPSVGGLELIDVSNIQKPTFKPREIGLIRHRGFSHTHTVDAAKPWIVYNSTSDFSTTQTPWIDVVDVRSCINSGKKTLNQMRNQCRPLVYRIPFDTAAGWSKQQDSVDGNLVEGTDAACHDITSVGTRLYCATPNATLIFDVSGLVNPSGGVNGTPLPCTVVPGTDTAAMVTDCSGAGAGSPSATGWAFLGSFHHPGRDCQPGRTSGDPTLTNCNSNVNVPPDEGVSIAHEADPTPDGNYMFVTDERGGGVVPPGSSCTTGLDSPLGNGGMHVFDISDPASIEYALMADGDSDPGNDPKAVFISDFVPTTPTFCDIHVIEQIPNEQRLIVAYYSGGTKIVDYWIDADGRWYFRETDGLILEGANTWAVEDFLIKKNPNGTKTYYLAASDIQRGIDVLSWTGPPNKIGSQPPPTVVVTTAQADLGLLGLALLGLPLAAYLGRRRRRSE